MSSSGIGTQAASTNTDFWWATLVKSVRRRIARIRSERRIRRDIDALMVLDGRMLADIGLSRGDVECAARYGQLPARANDRVCREPGRGA